MNPDTTVIGAKRIVERDPKTGKVSRDEWESGKVDTYEQHWKNAAAKKRCGGDFSKAKPGEVKIVPVFRGMPSRFANEVRSDIKRRRTNEANIKEALGKPAQSDVSADVAAKLSSMNE